MMHAGTSIHARPLTGTSIRIQPSPPVSRAGVARAVALLIIFAIAHGLALKDGTVLDDFWHQKGLREHGWSFHELLRTLNISTADYIHTWWQTKSVTWDYFRPFFILCMKFLYVVLGRGDPVALHAFSLVLHLTSTLLIWRLAWLLTRDSFWSWIAAIMFAIYPHSVITVAWPSSQNVVIQTTLVLAAILTYVRGSGLCIGPGALVPAARGSPVYMLLTFVLWLIALFTRENALLLPAIFAAFDLSFGGWRQVRGRLWAYATFLLLGAGFFLWRESMHVHPLPDLYCRRPNGDWAEYVPWLAAKLLHYVCASIWIAPITAGPTGRFNPWREAPGDCALMVGIVATIGLIYWTAARRARGWWIWPAWIVLFILPVVAVVATPHSGYMSAVGFALGMAVACAAATRATSKAVRTATLGLAGILVLGSAFMTGVNRLQWEGIKAAERYVPDWVRVAPPSRETSHVFFVNLPFINVYIKPNLVARLGPWFEHVNVDVLTYAPHPLLMDRPSVLEQIDERSFAVSIQGQPYFSRLLGRFLLEGFGDGARLREGETIGSDEFDVTIIRADQQGVEKLLFKFHKPLNDPQYCFYFVSSECGAARINFDAKESMTSQATIHDPAQLDGMLGALKCGSAAAALPLFDYIASGATHEGMIINRADDHLDMLGTRLSYVPVITIGPHRFENYGIDAERAVDTPPAQDTMQWAAEEFMPICRYMARALGSPQQSCFDKRSISRDEWNQLRDWWVAHVHDRDIRQTWQHRQDFDDLIWLRSEIDWDRHVSTVLFHSDLYLTGPPFPGPRN
jgi:hypothetical protein